MFQNILEHKGFFRKFLRTSLERSFTHKEFDRLKKMYLKIFFAENYCMEFFKNVLRICLWVNNKNIGPKN